MYDDKKMWFHCYFSSLDGAGIITPSLSTSRVKQEDMQFSSFVHSRPLKTLF